MKTGAPDADATGLSSPSPLDQGPLINPLDLFRLHTKRMEEKGVAIPLDPALEHLTAKNHFSDPAIGDGDHLPKINPELLCCFCDELLPASPSARFLKLSSYLQGVSEVKRRVSATNQLAFHLPSIHLGSFPGLQTTAVCIRQSPVRSQWVKIAAGQLKSSFQSSQAESDLTDSISKMYVIAKSHRIFSGTHWRPGRLMGDGRSKVYGVQGYKIILKELQSMFMRSAIQLAQPLDNDFLLRKVLIPEVVMCLIAEDYDLPVLDPRVRSHLEDSRSFGSVVFPDSDDE
ncbi:uncharacterized protein PGTG_14066 [Puccinia graminis f. sp. tritici CRL 75-36-700-3]|uniref:Restriction of telomere capping protein 4 n=1 Tax=Puccinia graminis f. sp. tritici (strain CRL 75-36-700-3 / race SCCL) TaxID=418459 RepID=E3KW13_PUCGT|nr:uncharacterized protein PGTG_14066 [Puccinia graminis f. sp. tritici CRL 75-36-700-3]EFP88488.2 hypothetical protein PGTG_14066 [Puccinia graminis f. sp. tritici CRL 75-36-700-3]